MPTVSQLKYILAVERLRHFGKAAKACHVSQPTLSMQIQKVEEECGFALFDRLKKPVVPTDQGKRFLDVARSILREYDRLAQFARKDKGQMSGELRLGIIPTLAPYLLPLFLEDFSQRYPKVKLIVEELKTESILKELDEDHLDVALLATPTGETGFHEEPLYYEPFSLYVSEGHALAKKSKLRAEDLDGSELWLLQDGNCFRNQVVQFCSLPASGGKRKGRISFEAGSLETLRNLVKNSEGYTLMPALATDFLPPAEREKHVRPFATPTPAREISLVHRRDQWRSDLIDALADSIKRCLPKHLKTARPKEYLILEAC
jgi:LysR family hydrogen peroxide-inducible transcriptional activator